MKTSLDHLPESKQQELATISTILRDTLEDYLQGKTASKSEFRIVKIILFGSHAKGTWVNDPVNGYISDYDILVIVNKAALVEEDVVWQRAKEQIDRKVTSAPLGLIVHDLQEVNERLQQGHYFFKDIREEGIELFAATPKPLAEPGDLTEAEQREIARKHYEQWFESAEQLFVFFQDGMKRQWLKQSAFLLHQSTERFFACTLLTCTNYLPKSHNIEKLGKLCAQIDAEFATIFPLDNKFHRRCFRRLQRAYIEARYSEHYEITVEELEYLQGEVQKLRELLEWVCLERVG
ncbi:HEPN domain-containing protein [Vibrio rhizosphaerae]|uniref:HEPN domain-containing protein n=1 Tax=Vibrio rhizosphaerae TaxID=398736 RepID=A0ABU4ITH1_9VIBR|nr:HEPN domain-containing protein [Vibrio rhizosphaerae]MDW6092428.1 HEPN domain-containing protein [Vibrio rhizosphaerae]